MVEVDVFWAYGIGAGFALAAAAQLRSPGAAPAPASGRAGTGVASTGKKGEPGADPHLYGAALYCAALFAPSGAWLLWGYPSWETMHVGAYDTIPAWLVALFAATNTTQGVLGYLVTRRLLRAGRLRLAVLQLVAAYFGMFFILVHGWDGRGYQRFFSATREEFRAWEARPALSQVGEWMGSGVALTLYGMGVVLLPILFTVYVRWHRAGRRSVGDPPGGWAFFGTIHALIWLGGLGVAVAASVVLHLLGWWIGGVLAIGLLVALWSPAVRRAVPVLIPQRTRSEPLVDATVEEVAGTRSR